MIRKLCFFPLTLILLAFAAACGGGDDGGSTAVDTDPTRPPATATAPACPVNAAACALARSLQGWLDSGDTMAILTVHRQQSYECPGGEPLGAGGPFPLCQGIAKGVKVTGLQMARRYSEGFIISPPDYMRIMGQLRLASDVGASDAYGPGSLRLYSLGCLDAACSKFTVIFSAILKPASIPPIGTLPGREVLVFFAEAPSVAAPLITSTWTGVILPGEEDAILGKGGILFDLGRIVPYRGQ